jgi:anion-transporting  ArsA/GET3 family ATPase
LIVVDGPAAGHAVTFLTSAAGLRDAVRSGPVRAQAEDVVAMLADPDRCQVVLVTVPETTPVNELLETAEVLRGRVAVRLGPVVVNQVDDGPPVPDPAAVSFGRTRTHVADAVAAAEFRRTSRAGQAGELTRIRDSVGSAQIILLSAVATAALQPSDIVALAASVHG